MAKNHTTQLSIHPDAPFDFEYTAYSHGWVVLSPNVWDLERRVLQRVERLAGGKVVALSIHGPGSVEKPQIRIKVNHPGKLSAGEAQEITAAVAHMFRADENFAEFYKLCNQKDRRWKNLGRGLGRLLRSPNVFEDVVKTICTTNIQWGGTKRMVAALVDTFGTAHDGNPALKTFPAPQTLAEVPFERFRKMVSLGYRSEYIHLLAGQVSSGELNLNSFLDPAIPTPELKKKLLAIKGVGNYAAATLLMLLGRYDELPVDSVFRQFVSKKYFHGERISDQQAQTVYAGWGKWKYLAYWFDIWEGFNEKF